MTARVEFSLGPNRPNPPNNAIITLIANAVSDVLGPQARVVVTSGTENPGEQYGSNRHSTGLAADVAIFDASGRRVRATDPAALEIARAAARRGAKGIGWGPEYMGGENFHIDIVEPGPSQAHTWGSEGRKHRDEIVAIINGAPPASSFAQDDLPNPLTDPLDMGFFGNPLEASQFAEIPYTAQEREFLAIYDMLALAERNRPQLIELDNLVTRIGRDG